MSPSFNTVVVDEQVSLAFNVTSFTFIYSHISEEIFSFLIKQSEWVYTMGLFGFSEYTAPLPASRSVHGVPMFPRAQHRLNQFQPLQCSLSLLCSVLRPWCFLVFQEPVKRILALTETCLVERDPASYNIVTIKPFGEVSHEQLESFWTTEDVDGFALDRLSVSLCMNCIGVS